MSRTNIIVAGCLFFLISFQTRAQQQFGHPEFEVAAIRTSSGDCMGGGKPQTGRLTLNCITLSALIQMAYGYFADGVSYTPNVLQFRGRVPGWVSLDRYNIAATASGEPSQAAMRGHFLTVAKGGIRMPKTAHGGCSPVDLNRAGNPYAAPAAEPCGTEARRQKGRLLSVTAHGISLSNLADGLLSQLAERTVLDRTGISGLFDVHLEFAPDLDQPVSNKAGDPDAPSLFTAIREQLGLNLAAGTGPVPVFFIDRVDRPSAN